MVRPAGPLTAQANRRDADAEQATVEKTDAALTARQEAIQGWIDKVDAEIAKTSQYGRWTAMNIGHVDATTAGWHDHIAATKVPEVVAWYVGPLLADLRANGYSVKTRVQHAARDHDEPGAHTGYDMIIEVSW